MDKNYMWYTYVLKSLKDGRYYIGATSNLEQRVIRHNAGGNVSTKHRRPLQLVYSEVYPTKEMAYQREKILKSYKGGVAFKNLIPK